MDLNMDGQPSPTLANYGPARVKALWTLFLILISFSYINAEGIQQAAPSATDVVWLNIDGNNFGNFAAFGSANTTSGLSVELKAGECLYLGLSAGTSSSTFTNFLDNYNFQIVDAGGAIVHGPFVVDNANQNVGSYADAIGPSELGIPGGYDVTRVEGGVEVYKFCPASPGTYWIEFQDDFAGSNLRIPLWDFTVGMPNTTAIPGRLSSQNWSFRTPADGLDPGIFCNAFQRPFNGVLYSYTADGFVSRIDFGGSGFRGLTFNVAFDFDGPGITGSMADMRKSIEDANETDNAAEHKIFLSPPDPTCFLDGACGEMTLLGLTCTDDGFCINLNVTQAGSVEIILDSDGNGVFDGGTADLIIVESIPAAGDVCVMWDGLLGDGSTFMPGQNINSIFRFTQGVQHYAAYDVEYLTEGFCIETIRPAGCPTDNKLYWDDTDINSISGTSSPNDGRDGCVCQTAGCRTWDNFVSCTGSGPGYGNFNTMNTWWFAFISADQVLNVTLDECNITGDANVCIGDDINLTVAELPGATYTYTWTGPNMASGTGTTFTLPAATAAASGQYCVTLESPGGCGTVCCYDVVVGTTPSCTTSNPVSPSSAIATDGSFDLTATGGSAGYVYDVMDSNGSSVSSGMIATDGATTNVSGLAADTYTVQITDANGCFSTCSVIIELVDISIEKMVTAGPDQTGNPNEFSITYTLDVINNGSGTEQYNLSDTLKYGLGANVVSASVSYLGGGTETLSGIDNSAAFDGLTDYLITTNEMIASASNEQWEVTVVFTVDPITLTTQSEDCTLDPGEAGTGLLNCAAISGDVPMAVAEDCETIPVIMVEIDKMVTSAPQPTGAVNEFSVSYNITVENTGNAVASFDLSDTLKYGGAANVQSVSVNYIGGAGETSTGVDNSLAFDGQTDYLIVSNEMLATAATEEWEVVVVFTVDPVLLTMQNADCTLEPGEAGTGLLNCASATGSVPTVIADDCSPIPIIMVDIEKSITSGPLETGIVNQFSLDYLITVENTGDALAYFDLTDTLKYGSGAMVDNITVTYVGGANELLSGLDNSANYDGVTDNNIVFNESIEVGNIEEWAVTVLFSVDPAVTTGTSADCSLDPGEQGTGLLNCAAAGGAVPMVIDSACIDLPMPAVALSKEITAGPAPIPNASGQFIEYTITVESTGTATAYYDLIDTLAFGAGVQVLSSSVSYVALGAEILDGIDNTASYNGVSDFLIVQDESIAVGEIETWIVSVTIVADPAVITASDADCSLEIGEAGTGSLNSVTVSGGVPMAGDTVCTALALGKIGNFVWFECDGNGVQDPGEDGVEGIVVNLYGASGDFVFTTTTDANGEYEIDNILAGNYYVEFVISGANIFIQAMQGPDATLDSDVTGANGYGTTNTMLIEGASCDFDNWDAGITICTPVGDLVFYDTNMNDIFDESENGINGLDVNIYKQNFFSGEFELYGSTTTGLKPGTPSDDGWWKLCAAPGEYYFEIATPLVGLVPSQIDVGNNEEIDSDIDMFFGPNTSDVFTVECGVGKCDLGAGFYLMATAGDRVWRDDNGNGLQEESEPKMADITIEVYDNTGVKIQETTSNAEGEYFLDYLQKEEYYFKVVLPPGFNPTTSNAGSDEIDSDITGANGPGTTDYYFMEPGEHVAHVDIGLVNGILPVEYLYFTGEVEADHNLIMWTTLTEINNKQFELERSINGGPFILLEVIEGAGTTNAQQDYYFKDYDVRANGDYYYRLKQVDFDNFSMYSDILTLNRFKEGKNVELYPNPVNNQVHIDIHIDELVEEYQIDIFDITGKLVYTEKLEGYNKIGSVAYTISVNDFIPGVYNLKIQYGSGFINKQFIKRP